MTTVTSGGVRYDFTGAQAITYGEARSLRWPVDDEDGVAIADFTGYEFTVWIIDDPTVNGPAALALAAELELTDGDGLTVSVPNVTWAVRAADWTALGSVAKTWHYELWRTDTGDENRLAYGSIETVN